MYCQWREEGEAAKYLVRKSNRGRVLFVLDSLCETGEGLAVECIPDCDKVEGLLEVYMDLSGHV